MKRGHYLCIIVERDETKLHREIVSLLSSAMSCRPTMTTLKITRQATVLCMLIIPKSN